MDTRQSQRIIENLVMCDKGIVATKKVSMFFRDVN